MFRKLFSRSLQGIYTVTAIAGIMPWKVYDLSIVSRMFGGNFSKQFKRKEKHGYSAAQAVKQLDKWFVLEKKWKDFSPEKRLSCRQQELRPLFIAFMSGWQR